MPDVLDTVKKWVGQLVEVGLLLVAVAIVAQILFGRDVAFLPGDVVGNIIRLVDSLGDNGLVGLIAVGVVIWLFCRRRLS